MAQYYIVVGIPRDDKTHTFEMLHGTYDRNEAHDQADIEHEYKSVRVVRLHNASNDTVLGCMRELRTFSDKCTAKGIEGFGVYSRREHRGYGEKVFLDIE